MWPPRCWPSWHCCCCAPWWAASIHPSRPTSTCCCWGEREDGWWLLAATVTGRGRQTGTSYNPFTESKMKIDRVPSTHPLAGDLLERKLLLDLEAVRSWSDAAAKMDLKALIKWPKVARKSSKIGLKVPKVPTKSSLESQSMQIWHSRPPQFPASLATRSAASATIWTWTG